MAGPVKRLLTTAERIALAFLILYAVPVWYITTVDGRLFPVVRDTEITSIRGEGDRTIITAQSFRTRRCEWMATRWYLGRPGQDSEQLSVNFDVRPKIIEYGPVTVEATIVGADPRSILNGSYAVARYKCWNWPFYEHETQTMFYLGNGKEIGLLLSDAGSNRPSLTNGDGHTTPVRGPQ